MPDTCPHCGDERPATGERCPACGRSRLRAAAPWRARRRLLPAAGAAVVFAAGGLALLIGQERDRAERDRAERRARVEELRAEIRRIQAPHRGSAIALRPPPEASDARVLAARRSLLRSVEAAILADARRRTTTGEIDGPVRSVSCGPLSGAPGTPRDEEDLRAPVGRYSCTARLRDVLAGGGRRVAIYGYAYVAAVRFGSFTYVYCRNTPAQGERGVALVQVRLERACLAARGRPVGTGYASVPDPPLPRR